VQSGDASGKGVPLQWSGDEMWLSGDLKYEADDCITSQRENGIPILITHAL